MNVLIENQLVGLDELVLANVLTRKIKATPLQPGVYSIKGTATIKVDAKVSKGEPCQVRQTPPYKEMLAVALRKAGCQRANIEKDILALLDDAGNKENNPYMEDVEKLFEKFPKKPREGNTTIIGTVETSWQPE